MMRVRRSALKLDPLIQLEKRLAAMLDRTLADPGTPFDPLELAPLILEHQAKGEVVTGLLYAKSDSVDLHEHLNTAETAFNRYTAGDLCPGTAMLERLNASLR